jgi:hypothetical protein
MARLVRLTLRHDVDALPDDLRGVPADQLLGLALKCLLRRFGWRCVLTEELSDDADERGPGEGCGGGPGRV